jgi:hypothetical protein
MKQRITLVDRQNGVTLFVQRFERAAYVPDDWFVIDLDDLVSSFESEREARAYFERQAARARVRRLAGI